MKKIGVIGVPGIWSSEHLADALERRTGFRLLMPIEEITLDLGRGKLSYRGDDLDGLDGLVIKKIGSRYSHHSLDRLEVLRHLNSEGMPIFSSPRTIARAIDRLSCTLTLSRGGIPIPDTVITEQIETAADTVSIFGKAVLKPLFTSKARGMKVLEDSAGIRAEIESFHLEHPVMYIQKLVKVPGRDLGLVFLGGEYLATYARVGRKDTWTTTTHFGGRYESFEPSPELVELARKAQALFGLAFTCVDVAETPEGPNVFEVSAFGGYRGLLEAHGIDAAQLFADYVLKSINDGRTK